MEKGDTPLSPWTAGHRMTFTIATPESVMTYDDPIRCPSSWTPDHRMNAIRQMSEMIYGEYIQCPSSWTLDGMVRHCQTLGTIRTPITLLLITAAHTRHFHFSPSINPPP